LLITLQLLRLCDLTACIEATTLLTPVSPQGNESRRPEGSSVPLPGLCFADQEHTVMHDGDKPRRFRIPVWIYLAAVSIGLAIAVVLNVFWAQSPA